MVWNTVLAAASVTLTGRKRDTAYRVKREVGGGGKGFSKASLQFKKWPLATEAKLTASVKTLSPEINCMHPGGQRNFSNVFPLIIFFQFHKIAESKYGSRVCLRSQCPTESSGRVIFFFFK